jgi:competence ComEA-like helix-hairpin-helix protein
MMLQKILQSLTTFSKNERVGIYLLLLISTGIWIFPLFFSRDEITLADLKITEVEINSHIQTLSKRADSQSLKFIKLDNANRFKPTDSLREHELFSFNPNKTRIEDWMRLGLSERNAKTINNFLAKGGYFKSKEDLKKIYGIPPQLIETIIPFAVFDEESKNISQQSLKAVKTKKILNLDINTADSNALTMLPGIGERLAARIVKYRNRLGGFVQVSQLLEVYGVQDSILDKITPMIFVAPSFSIDKVDINKIDYALLTKHPYMTYSMAKIILAYRKAHGSINGADEMYSIAGIPQEQLVKFLPYCTY